MARYLVDKGADLNIKNDAEVSEREYTADCKLVLLVRVCFHSPEQKPLLLIELYGKFYDNCIHYIPRCNLKDLHK